MNPRWSWRLSAVLASGGALALLGGARPAPAEVLRTFVHHEITRLPSSPNVGGGQGPVLSSDGSRAVFAVAPGTGDPAKPNRIYVVNADGSGLREVDAYQTLCFCGSLVDISANGLRVLSSDAVQLRIASTEGGGGRTLLTLNSNELAAIRISGDGNRVFFSLRRNAALASGTALPGGIYVMGADGDGLRRIVSSEQVAALLGLPVDQVFVGANHPQALAVSHDGSRIAFQAYVQAVSGGFGQGAFAVNGDGTGLVSLIGRQGFVGVAISADGATVGYATQTLDNTSEIGVVPSGGGERRTLVRQAAGQLSPLPTGMPSLFAERLTLSGDGSRLLAGSTGVLLDTATGAALQLSARGGYFSTPEDNHFVGTDGLFHATMNASATRFLYIAFDAANIAQLATLDINPSGTGEAPSVTEVTVEPGFVLLEGRSTATLRARVSGPNVPSRVSAAAFHDGLVDRNVSTPVLLDAGSRGDTVAQDGIFAANDLAANCCAQVGPQTVRVKAEARDASGRRHATVVEIAPFEVRRP